MMMPYDPNLSNSLTLTLVSEKVSINGNEYPVDDLARILQNSTNSSDATILARLDQSTPMSIVERVFRQLKEVDQRKIIFFGQNTAGVEVEVPMEIYKYEYANPGTGQVTAAGKRDPSDDVRRYWPDRRKPHQRYRLEGCQTEGQLIVRIQSARLANLTIQILEERRSTK